MKILFAFFLVVACTLAVIECAKAKTYYKLYCDRQWKFQPKCVDVCKNGRVDSNVTWC